MKISMIDGSYDFFEMKGLVEKDLGYDIRDCGKHFYPETGKFEDWHKKKKYPKYDSEGKEKSSSQIFFSEYMKDIREGKWLDTPYCDFWHFQLNNCFEGFNGNGSHNLLYIEDCFHFKLEDWQKTIQNKYYELFKDLSDEDGYVSVYVEW